MDPTSNDDNNRAAPPMVEKKKRISPRIEIGSLIAYVMVDRSRRIQGKGVARVINLSCGGLKLQTRKPVKTPFLLLSLAVEGEKPLAVLVKVSHCQEFGRKIFHYGLKFLEDDEKNKQFVLHLVKDHTIRKNSRKGSCGIGRQKDSPFRAGGVGRLKRSQSRIFKTSEREYPRLEVESPITYRLFPSDDPVVRFGEATVCNISHGGMMIESREPIGSGTIKVAITVVGEKSQVIEGRVIHCREAGDGRFHTGIKFLASDSNRRLAAAALVKKHRMGKNSSPMDEAERENNSQYPGIGLQSSKIKRSTPEK